MAKLSSTVEEQNQLYGKYRGIVTDNQDPCSIARLRVRVPSVLGDCETGWALPCLPYAHDGIGVGTIPPPGTRVWIELEGGDPDYPIWSGCFWLEGAKRDESKPSFESIKKRKRME